MLLSVTITSASIADYKEAQNHTKLDDSIQRYLSKQGNEGSTSGCLTVRVYGRRERERVQITK